MGGRVEGKEGGGGQLVRKSRRTEGWDGGLKVSSRSTFTRPGRKAREWQGNMAMAGR